MGCASDQTDGIDLSNYAREHFFAVAAPHVSIKQDFKGKEKVSWT